MGRRKIEIKPIRDDRNRSVTFLKRKGGLFKKAHELSVLCSVDVAVIIFGHNKKLYEYSSGDINEIIGRFQYYGGAHEHKGPLDFADKGGGDDDDDDDGGDEGGDEQGTPAPMMHPQMQNHPGFQHVRHGTPSHSPPMPNGAMPQFQRGPSPLPPGMMISRPSSRTSQHTPSHQGHVRRVSSNLVPVPQQQPHPGPPPPGQPAYTYQPNAPFFNPQAAVPPMQRPPQQHGGPYQPGFQTPPQVQQPFLEDTRRVSMPAGFAPHGIPQQAQMQRNSQEQLQPPQHPQVTRHLTPQPQHQQPPRPTPSPQPPQHQFTSPPIPQPRPLPAAKAQVIFTPIDDSRSMLAQHWGATSAAAHTSEPSKKSDESKDGVPARPASIDNPSTLRNGPQTSHPSQPIQPPQRTASTPLIQPPSRTSTHQSSSSADLKRPRLTVQIPSEQSEEESGPGGGTTSAPASSTYAPSAHYTHGQRAGGLHGVVLPPPSPSASSLLSAGAQGPPNPFARPAPPMTTNPHAMNRDAHTSSSSSVNAHASSTSGSNSNTIETPISALPSRFMSDNLLPSPSTFYPEWNFGRPGDPGMLPSPLNFSAATPGPNSTSAGLGWERGAASKEDKPGEQKDKSEKEAKEPTTSRKRPLEDENDARKSTSLPPPTSAPSAISPGMEAKKVKT